MDNTCEREVVLAVEEDLQMMSKQFEEIDLLSKLLDKTQVHEITHHASRLGKLQAIQQDQLVCFVAELEAEGHYCVISRFGWMLYCVLSTMHTFPTYVQFHKILLLYQIDIGYFLAIALIGNFNVAYDRHQWWRLVSRPIFAILDLEGYRSRDFEYCKEMVQ